MSHGVRKLFAVYGSKRVPVASIEDASDKWNAFRDRAMSNGDGPDEIGSGIVVVDSSGVDVARISWNGRIWLTGESGPGESKVKKAKCPHCGKSGSAANLKKHIQATHGIFPPTTSMDRGVESSSEAFRRNAARGSRRSFSPHEREESKPGPRVTHVDEETGEVYTAPTYPEFEARRKNAIADPLADHVISRGRSSERWAREKGHDTGPRPELGTKTFVVVRINRDPRDTYARELPPTSRRIGSPGYEGVLAYILESMAAPDPGSHIEVSVVAAPDAGAARLLWGGTHREFDTDPRG